LCHTTTYEYSNAVAFQPHILLLRPREGHDIRIVSSVLQITPGCQVKWSRDIYDNSVGLATFSEPGAKLSIHSEVVIEHYEEAPLDFLVQETAVNFPFHYNATERINVIPYTIPVFPEDSAAVVDWLNPFWQPGQLIETFVLLDQLTKAIHQRFTYVVREEEGVQSPATTLEQQQGSCRDFATLLIEACRGIGLAARFVSGYLHSPVSEAGQGSTHAWAEIYLPGAGWKGFDPTSGEVVGSHHIPVAVHRHPEAIPPIRGAFSGTVTQSPSLCVSVYVEDISAAKI
jgi:transglutaminase-like putative cysteine protease